MKIMFVAPLAMVAILSTALFQNCGSNLEFKDFSSMTRSQVGALLDKKIWTLNSIFLTSKKLIFYVNPNIFEDDVSFGWIYTLNGITGNCSAKPYSTFSHAIELECYQPGILNLTVNVVKSDFTSEKINFAFEVKNHLDYQGLSELDHFIPDSQLVLMVDGSPGPAYAGNDPGSIEYSGRTLYAAYCQSCHGVLESTSKRKRSSVQIKNAITTENSMKNLSLLTEAEINKIADALNF